MSLLPQTLEDWIMKHPRLRNIVFRKRIETEEFLNSIVGRKEINGCSFLQNRLCLSIIPTAKEIDTLYQELERKVDSFLFSLMDSFPNIKEISQEEYNQFSSVLAVKTMLTFYDGIYLVSAVIFLEKRKDGSWTVIAERQNIEGPSIPQYSEYPKDIKVSFCGCFGDVVELKQSEFSHSSTRFFTK